MLYRQGWQGGPQGFRPLVFALTGALVLLASCVNGNREYDEAEHSAFGEYVYALDTLQMEQCLTHLLNADTLRWAADDPIHSRYASIGKYENELYPGIYELLSDLKADKRFVGIASSKPTVFVEDILAYFRIRPFFDVVCGSELNGTKNKKEEVLEEALQMLFGKSGMGREDTVMVGDRKFDVEAADKLGVAGIAVSYGYGSVEELTKAGAKIIVSSVQELREKLF